MSRIKVSDLEITEREAPILVYVEPAQPGLWSDKEPKLPVLHISTSKGKAHGAFRSRYFSVTLCNRPLEYDRIVTDDAININKFRLCARCAKKQDFDEALEQYHEWRARCERERQERERIKAEQARQAGEERSQRLDDFRRKFFSETYVDWIGFDHQCFHAFTVKYNGHAYRIEETD